MGVAMHDHLTNGQARRQGRFWFAGTVLVLGALFGGVDAAGAAPVKDPVIEALQVAVEADKKHDAKAVEHFFKAVKLAVEAKRPTEAAQGNEAIQRLREGLPKALNDKLAKVSAIPPGKQAAAAAWSALNQEAAARMAKGDARGAVEQSGKALEKAQAEFGAKHYTVFVGLRELAVLQYQAGAMAEAEGALEKSLALGRELLGAEHPETLKVLALRGDLLEGAGVFPKALETRKAVLAGWETAVGATHPASLDAGMTLVRLHLNVGEVDQPFKWLGAARERFEKTFGLWHPRLAEYLTLLASTTTRKGDLKAALALYDQADRIYLAVLPPGEPAALSARVEAAELIRRDGRFDEARKKLEEVIAVAKKVAAAQPLLDAQGALAQVFEDAGEYEKAEPLITEVLQGETQLLGADHPNLLATRNRLAGVYRRQGRLAEAEKLYAATLDGYRKIVGTEHQASINVMNNLGLVFENEGLYDEAEPLLRAAWQSSRKMAGEDHPETLATLNNLALLHESQGNFDKAEPLYRNAIASAAKSLGEKHPDAAAFVNNLAYLYLLQQNYKEAAPLFEKVLALWTEIYGEAHQKTLKALNNLARVRHKLGARDEAEKLFLKALEKRKTVLGEKHMDVLRSMRDLGALYLDMGRLKDAEELLRKAL
ncbi:MAG: tetratricopeptide repeat protein, partial [Magnetococcales bacterium]|nr:tetratricopeptide repeat protein [Magnetococcales bacterium]